MLKLAVCIGLLGSVSVAGSVARAAEPSRGAPLLVAAEIEAGLGLRADDVRRAIGEELRRPIVAPAAGPTVETRDLLLVSVGAARTVVTFRPPSDERASRAIATPADREARLRAVAWLAGNLARDQVSPLVLAAAAETPRIPAAAPGATPASSDAATVPPPATPTPAPAPASAGGALEGLVQRALDPISAPKWRISIAAGQAAEYVRGSGGPWPVYTALAWQAEVQHLQADGWLLGFALDYGPNAGNGLGYALTAGIEQRWRRLRLEESLGLGLEEGAAPAQTTQVQSSLTGTSSRTVVSPELTAYSRGFVTATYPLSRSFDLVARVGAHFDLAGAFENTLAITTLGVRVRLP